MGEERRRKLHEEVYRKVQPMNPPRSTSFMDLLKDLKTALFGDKKETR